MYVVREYVVEQIPAKRVDCDRIQVDDVDDLDDVGARLFMHIFPKIRSISFWRTCCRRYISNVSPRGIYTITRVAAEVIACEGVEAATVRRVSAVAGYSTSIVTYYFADKHELLLAA